jgi:hypothetical protein
MGTDLGADWQSSRGSAKPSRAEAAANQGGLEAVRPGQERRGTAPTASVQVIPDLCTATPRNGKRLDGVPVTFYKGSARICAIDFSSGSFLADLAESDNKATSATGARTS